MTTPRAAGTSARAVVPFLDLRAQYSTLRDEIRAAMDEVLASQQFILGSQGEALEQELAAYCDAKHAVGLANGTDALTFALAASGVGPGDEVIVPAFSFVATGTAVVRLGARPVFADIEPKTFNLAPEQIAARRTPRTKAVMPVHLYGLPAELNSIGEIASRHGIAVVEDNAQAIGARYHGARTGSFGAATGISFYPTKNLGAYGDGGMLVTNSAEIASRVRRLRDHGQESKYVSAEPGWNSRLDELQAAILRVKLRRLDEWTLARQAHARRYDELLRGLPGLMTPSTPPHCEHVYHLYTVRIEGGGAGPARRDRVKDRLGAAGIASAVYYPAPLPSQPLFASHGHRKGEFPISERASQEVLSLPMFPELASEQIERVAEGIATALKEV
jgi:dTDP-4-amino-4,6-dideoxygalactose transaminase